MVKKQKKRQRKFQAKGGVKGRPDKGMALGQKSAGMKRRTLLGAAGQRAPHVENFNY